MATVPAVVHHLALRLPHKKGEGNAARCTENAMLLYSCFRHLHCQNIQSELHHNKHHDDEALSVSTGNTTHAIVTATAIFLRRVPRCIRSPKSVDDIMHEFPDVKVKNSGPTGTPLRKQAKQNPGGKKTFTKQPTYFPSMQNTKGTLVTKDARRSWEAAVTVSPERLYEKNMCPPSHDEHGAMKKTNISVFIGRPLRAEHTPVTEPAWLSRAVNLLPSVEDKNSDSLYLDSRDQYEERLALLTGDTFEVNSRYSNDLKGQLPMPKEMLLRARYAFLMDSTSLKNVLFKKMVMMIQLSRIPEIAEALVTMFDPEMTGTHREPPPKRIIISNVLDHLAC